MEKTTTERIEVSLRNYKRLYPNSNLSLDEYREKLVNDGYVLIETRSGFTVESRIYIYQKVTDTLPNPY